VLLGIYTTTKMGNVFAPEKPLKEIVRENQRLIKKSIRELEKEIRSLETNQKKLENDIKKHAKMNQMVSVQRLRVLVDVNGMEA
jgi:septal ring factor EnvC (AmiA/AmiB activator)